MLLLLRCSRRSECSRAQGPEQWLWSFQSELGCLRVVAVSPANISRGERREVSDQSGQGPRGESCGDGRMETLDFLCHCIKCHMSLISHFSWALNFSNLLSIKASGRW